MKLSETPKGGQKSTRLLLLVAVVSLTGCATNSLSPDLHCPLLPEKPVLREPMPSQPYSITAQELLKAWRAKLMATQPTQ